MARWAPTYTQTQRTAALTAMLEHKLTAAETARRATAGTLAEDLEPFNMPAGTARAWKSTEERRRGLRPAKNADLEANSLSSLERRTRSKIASTLKLIDPSSDDAEDRLLVVTKALAELGKIQKAHPDQRRKPRGPRKQSLSDKLTVAGSTDASGS